MWKPSTERARTTLPSGASPPDAAPMFHAIRPTPIQTASRYPITPSAMRAAPDRRDAAARGVRADDRSRQRRQEAGAGDQESAAEGLIGAPVRGPLAERRADEEREQQ